MLATRLAYAGRLQTNGSARLLSGDEATLEGHSQAPLFPLPRQRSVILRGLLTWRCHWQRVNYEQERQHVPPSQFCEPRPPLLTMHVELVTSSADEEESHHEYR
jgi:hypothetical protein